MSSSTEAPANIRVLVRVRPLNDRESKFNPTNVLGVDNGGMASSIDFGIEGSSSKSSRGEKGSGGTIHILDQATSASIGSAGYLSDGNNGNGGNGASASSSSKKFTYDAVFGPRSQQTEVFDSIKGIIDAVCAGYNGTIVAYGQTGSGKTHTIFGEEGL